MGTSPVVTLSEAAGQSIDVVGGKAANLARSAAAGFPVRPGFVVTLNAWTQPPGLLGEAISRALAAEELDAAATFAVRSSARAEDLRDASYAGQYETFLDVPRERVAEAVARCRDAATAPRVAAYATGRRQGDIDEGIAVLVQPMVPARAAGVAFTANPVTGDRGETIVTAVRGLGERLVGGEAVGDEWVVRGRDVIPRRTEEQAISSEQALAVSRLARRVEKLFRAPQDIEWAIEADGTTGWRLLLLQARPMTALPHRVTWDPPGPGLWSRNFRLGEWLPEPMTPLFADWLLPLIEDGYLDAMLDTIGARIPFRYATVNGWYFNATPRPKPRLLLDALVRTRGRILRTLFGVLIQVSWNPAAADRNVLTGLHREWIRDELPAYERLIADAQERQLGARLDELIDLVDRLGRAAGRQLWFLSVVGGSAWKMEACLASFVEKHLADLLCDGGPLEEGVQVLLRAQPGIDALQDGPLIQSADWHRSIARTPAPAAEARQLDRRRALGEQRDRAVTACLAALSAEPRRRRRFAELLEVAGRYAVIREHQARVFPAAWPTLRGCALALGDALRAEGRLTSGEQVFFLHLAELRGGDALGDVADARSALWQQQLQQPAPLTIGSAPRLLGDPVGRAVERARGSRVIPPDAIVGQPASTGIATGPARVITDPSEFPSFRHGDVLVATSTAPAWTPLFARAAAVITDGGALAAHASIVAREYGIPAVVGTGDATRRLTTGQLVTVNGTVGVVTVAD
ncbi:PEP/pyruvate-binding domain-containing protein [Agromyces bauzanensis]